jgi:DedD protein
MAKAISDEELQLKKRARRRLVGAVALVLLIVVFLPMILDSEPKPLNQDIAINIPPIPRAESTPQIPAPVATVPATPSSAAPPHVAGLPEGAPAAPGPATVEPKSEPAKSEAKPMPKPAPKHEAKAVAATASHAGGDDRFVVQLGAFSNAGNAKALQRKLQDNKFKAYTEIVKNAGGDRTRVRVGPYPSREAAEKARDRLKSMKLIIGDAAVVRQD